MLGNSIKTVFEAVIFLFVVHPYDVGDGVKIGSQPDYYIVRQVLRSIISLYCTRGINKTLLTCKSHEMYRFQQVEEIALLNTTFKKSNGDLLLYPNSVISIAGVVNVSRSGPHTESIKVHIHTKSCEIMHLAQ